jgi:hypothetical protein
VAGTPVAIADLLIYIEVESWVVTFRARELKLLALDGGDSEVLVEPLLEGHVFSLLYILLLLRE